MRQSVETRKDEAAAERRSSAEQCGRYGIDIRGFRLHMEVDDVDEILASIEGIEGIVSVVDRRTMDMTFFGTADRKCGRYGVDVRGFRLHREADDLDEILASIEGIEGIVSIVDRQTSGRTFFGTVDQVRNAILRSIRTKRSHDDVSAGSER